MDMRNIGLKAVRWFVWLLLGWVFLRGIVSFLPGSAYPAGTDRAPLTSTVPAGVEVIAQLFAQEYLSWDPNDEGDRLQRLHPFIAQALRASSDWASTRPERGQRVDGTWVYEARAVSPTRWQVTVLARVSPIETTSGPGAESEAPQTGTAVNRLVYLAVPVAQTDTGNWVVYDHPSLLPPPAAGEFMEPLHYGQEIPDEGSQVKTFLNRFFQAYFNGNTTELTYYLTAGAPVRAFESHWSFDSIQDVTLSQTETGLYALAEVVLNDPVTGANYINRYTVGLHEDEGRWYVNEILQMR